VQEVRKKSRERKLDRHYVGYYRPWLQAYPTSDEFVLQLENPEVDHQTQGDQQAGRESQCTGRRKACRRMPELRGGC
jgi:hypothetical protein